MDFELSDEQAEFRRTLSDFADREIRPVARSMEQGGIYPTDIVEKLKLMGLFGMTIPTAFGGIELDSISLALVFEELSRAWMGVAGVLGSHSLACKMVATHGTEEQKQRLLPDLATGRDGPP